MGGAVRVEDRDREIVAIGHLDRCDNERVFRREKFVTALISAGDFVEHAMPYESVQNPSQGGDRSEGFGAIATRVDDLQTLLAFRKSGGEPFAITG